MLQKAELTLESVSFKAAVFKKLRSLQDGGVKDAFLQAARKVADAGCSVEKISLRTARGAFGISGHIDEMLEWASRSAGWFRSSKPNLWTPDKLGVLTSLSFQAAVFDEATFLRDKNLREKFISAAYRLSIAGFSSEAVSRAKKECQEGGVCLDKAISAAYETTNHLRPQLR
ncbi:MAG: hypothetical protein H6853_04275 [Rhodospirillales bacterium]|nr:MAG: hypothetical protein H6853_04275 [Rhodospirillales bacterium]